MGLQGRLGGVGTGWEPELLRVHLELETTGNHPSSVMGLEPASLGASLETWTYGGYLSMEIKEDPGSVGTGIETGSVKDLVLGQAMSLGLQETTWALGFWGPIWC